MLYKFLRSKKGFTLTELMVIATILAILTAISVPIMANVSHKQKLNDCINQREVISAVLFQVTSGMMDNGKKQPSIDFSNLQADHYTTYPGDGVIGNKDDAYVGQPCFILWCEKVDNTKDSVGVSHTINQLPVTIGAIRGSHREKITNSNQYPNYGKTAYSYNDGCAYNEEYAEKHPQEFSPHTNPQATCFLKKKSLENKALYTYLNNFEIPICPFVKYYSSADYLNKVKPEYYYYIFADGTVLCSCPECNEAD